MWTCNGTAGQKWHRYGREIQSDLTDGLFGMCLSTVNGFGPGASEKETAVNHTAVGLSLCDGRESQQWVTSDLFLFGPTTLLVITSDQFASTFAGFAVHKQSMGVPTKILSMSQVRSSYRSGRPSDDALSVKSAIEDYYRNFGTRYVLLGGDASQVPVRWREVGGGTTLTFIVSDLYYSNLYSGHYPGTSAHGAFDSWDANGNGVYDEQDWFNPLQNPDNVDGFPDVVVGRIPAYDTTSLSAALSKITAYENQTNFAPVNQFGWAADACYNTAYADIQSLSQGVGGPFYAEEIEPNNGCPAPSSGFIDDGSKWGRFQNAIQNSSFEWVTYIGHGSPSAWGYFGTWYSLQTGQLTNQYLPVVSAVACQTAQWENWMQGMPLSYRPPEYDPNAISSSSVNIGAEWIFNPNGGAVAYIGENIVMQDDAGTVFVGYFYNQHANGFARIGDMYRMAQQQYFDANYLNPGFDNHFSPPRIYLGVVNLLGDPSMRTK
jgi:hypothetical protein